jgi:two-component sensor histidine kinase
VLKAWSWKGVSATQLAVGLFTLFLALFVGLFAYYVTEGVQRQQERFADRSSYAAKVVSANTFWIWEVAIQTLRLADVELGETIFSAPDKLALLLNDLPAGTEIYIVDAVGNMVYSTIPGVERVSVDDRGYFQAVRNGLPFYTSALLQSKITGEPIFVVSKRVERGGTFAGAIMLSFPESLLQEIFETVDLDPGSTISLIRNDGQLMARHPPAGESVDMKDHVLFTQYLPSSSEGTYISAVSPVDGVARVVSYRTVPGTPIIALASIATDQAWQQFQRGIIILILVVSPVLIGLVLGCFWIINLLNKASQRSEELQASVDLNTMLFREIHHRVKNNLQSVQALVRMQDMPETAKRDLQSRFAAMAAMHEHIYMADRYEDIDAKEFIPAILREVVRAYGSDAELQLNIASMAVDRDHATPLALLLSELVTNAFKHALPDGGGLITVELWPREDGLANLVVRDNGPGMAEPVSNKSMGMRLINGIVAQMGGTYAFRNENGTVFEAQIALSIKARSTAEKVA